jgi:putative transposase
MPFKKHTLEESIGKLREAEIVLAQDGTTSDACRRLAISEQPYYHWRKEYGGLITDQARRMGPKAAARPTTLRRRMRGFAVRSPISLSTS